ncbi:MAG: hypothetical protein IKA09_11145 [Lachnospiraceae bacterium]|nr:hypothetical protein [Lachnospiraceae bacterium]
MPRIYVHFSGLDQIGTGCKTVASRVDTIETDFWRTIQALDWDVRYEADVNSAAKQISRKLEQQAKALRAYQQFINDTFDKYSALDEYKKVSFAEYLESPLQYDYPKLVEFDATAIFLGSRNSTIDGLGIAWTSDWVRNFNSLLGIGDNSSEIAVRKSIESIIKKVLKNKHNASDFYSEYADTLMPEEVELSKKIIDLFIKTGKTYTIEELAKLLSIDNEIFDQSQYLKCLTENQKFINAVSSDIESSIGAYGDAVKSYELIVESVGKVFNDYSKDAKYLESIKQALTETGYDNQTVNDVVDSLLWEYQNQYTSALHDGMKKAVEVYGKESGENIVKKLLQSNNAMLKDVGKVGSEASFLIDFFLEGKEITTNVSGLSDTTDNVANVYATQQYSYALVEKYESCCEKINSGIYSNSDIEQCNIYFQLAKEAKLQEYNSVKTILEDSLKKSTTFDILGGISNSISALRANKEDIEMTRDYLTRIESEIQRLENLKS